MSAEKPASHHFQTRNLFGVLRFLFRYPGAVTVQITLLLINIGVEMSLPAVLGFAIDDLRQLSGAAASEALWRYVGLFVFLVVTRSTIGFIVGPVRNRLVQRTLADIRNAIYNALQRLAFTYHDKANTGELVSRSTTDVQRLQDFFYACLFLSIDIGVALIVTHWLVFATSMKLGFLILCTVLPTIGLISFYAGRLQPQWRQVHDLHGQMTTVIQENIAGVRVVKAFAREGSEIERFRGKKEQFLETMKRTVNYWAARVPFAQFIFGLSMPLVLWVGGRQVIQGEIQLGELAKVVFYVMAIGHRVGAVGQVTNIVQNASASAARILEIIHEPQVLKSGRRELIPGLGEVVFDHVHFHYTDGRASLTDVSLVAPPGKTVAVVGPTGSGKSTLVNLIPRFYEVSAGSVRVDGVDVRELRLDELRRNVGVIFQETFLFSASVAENIAYGRPSATREEIVTCAKAAQAHEFICELEDGYDTVIGERGVSLSGGQRQRLAIARAFLVNPRILVLDDATASVDARTERLIQEAVRRLCEGRTTFIIAQRFSSVRNASLVLVLNQGRLVDQGTHSELLARNDFYRSIVKQQLAPEPSDAIFLT
jgi:ATP-binding cassette subfamily B protein